MYNIGDRVIFNSYGIKTGVGTIVEIKEDHWIGMMYLVELESGIGHDGNSLSKYKYTLSNYWWVYEHEMEKIDGN